MKNKNGIYKIECSKVYISQTKKKLKERYIHPFNGHKKPEMYKPNVAFGRIWKFTNTITTTHESHTATQTVNPKAQIIEMYVQGESTRK